QKLALSGKSLNAIGPAVGRVDGAVSRHGNGDVADEVLVRCADGLGGIDQRWPRFGADLSQRFSVGAPAAFELQRVHVEHQDAAAQVTVRQVDLAGRLVEVG